MTVLQMLVRCGLDWRDTFSSSSIKGDLKKLTLEVFGCEFGVVVEFIENLKDIMIRETTFLESTWNMIWEIKYSQTAL